MFVAILIINVLNLLFVLFAVYMLVKMSRAKWSIRNDDTRQAKQTTQMDREIAGGYFDYKMMIPDFKFANFTHNIPRASTSSINSDRSSYIHDSIKSSLITLEDENEEALEIQVINNSRKRLYD